MSRTQSLKYNKFEIYSNEDSSKFGNISGGTPKVLYRESVLEPSIEISVDVLETGGAFLMAKLYWKVFLFILQKEFNLKLNWTKTKYLLKSR